nr:MAG: replicase [Aspergillus flavus vivivirus 1]
MTSRVKALSGQNAPVMTSRVAPAFVTPSMVDNAVEDVLRDEDPAVGDQVRWMWSRDPDMEVAQMLRQGAAAMADRARFPKQVRVEVNVPYAMSDYQMRVLAEMFPEFKLTFNTSANHDHGVAAAVRHLDMLSMLQEIPPGMVFVDFGGNELFHIRNGNINARVVKMPLDARDPGRAQRARMELQVLAQKTAVAEIGSKDANAHLMATSVLQNRGEYVIRDRFEFFNHKALVGIMSHVYDVPVAAIPYTMERCGMKMLIIKLHFSNRFYDTDSGELPELGARYKIDRKNDVFEFGFVGSGARWYTHKWSEFQRYGADQILHGRKRRYSMKIVKRRGDTLTIRVLEIGGKALPNPDQYYRVPDVPCVRVTADLGRTTHDYGSSIDEVFPEDVWNRMVREAANDQMRGIVDYHKSVGNYSQIVAGHSYNGVDAVLGSVPAEKIPLLIALSSVSAAASLARMRAGIKYGIDLELDQRVLREADLGAMSFKLFYKSLQAVATAPMAPVVKAFDFMLNYTGEKMLKRLVEVEPVSQIRRIPVDVYDKVVMKKTEVPRDDFPARDYYAETQDMQEFLAQMAEEAKKPVSLPEGKHAVDGQEEEEDGTTLVGSSVPTARPAWMPLKQGMKYFPQDTSHGCAERKAAVQEEIEIVRQEAANLEAWMAVRWNEVMATGRPDKELLARKRDEWKDLDAWYVNDSIIVESVSGRGAETFKFGGVYCPAVMEVVDMSGRVERTKLRPVDDYVWTSLDESVQRIHKIVGGPSFTGWVLVGDTTRVHNGPLVVKGLQRALQQPMDYELGIYNGGPGSGKTTQMLEMYRQGHYLMSPLTLSITDLREGLQKKRVPTGTTQKIARTIDAWLCAAGRGLPVPKVAEVLSDEVFNGRAARAYAAWGLLRPERVIGFGDIKQIPPVDPSGSVRLYPVVKPQHLVENYIIHRYGPEILAVIGGHYEHKLRTSKPIGYSRVEFLDDLSDYKPEYTDNIALVMYQAQLVVARKRFPELATKVATTHSAQGKSVEEALLVQLDGRMRPKGDPFDLYQDACYVNVGCSRAKRRLVLGSLAVRSNLLNDWYEAARDPRRIAACADVASAGQSIEFL